MLLAFLTAIVFIAVAGACIVTVSAMISPRAYAIGLDDAIVVVLIPPAVDVEDVVTC